MQNAITDSLSLVDVSGYVVIAAILASLIIGVAANLTIRLRYAGLGRDLTQNPSARGTFSHAWLDKLVRAAREARRQQEGPVNTQALIEHHFQSQLKGLLLGERFVRSSTGLMIILGLVGTFYGLTLSIGKLVSLITSDASSGTDVAQTLTLGLQQALSGMAVAFTTSLVGIVAAIVMMLLGIVSNVTDRRTALMVELETYLDRLLAAEAPLSASAAGFDQSVARLEDAMARFESALQGFSATTRDFREFNLHLKDNVQRMSLSFGDFSEAIKAQVVALRLRDGG